MSGPEYVFDQVQIGKGLRPLAQHGWVVVDGGVLSLLGADRQPIDGAPLAQITASEVRFTRGRTLSLVVNGTKYNVSPGWGNQVGTVVTPGSTSDVRSAAGLLLRIIEKGRAG